jgi:hypothetical protein
MKLQRTHTKKNEQGIALFMAIFALMLLSAIAAGFMFLANTESAINANNKAGQLAFFASRAGLEEFKARIVTGATNHINPPTALPTLINGQIFYILNPANGENVRPWDNTNKFFDTTLCQARFAGTGLVNFEVPTTGVRCATAPAGAGWYTTFASNDPNTGTAAALPYKWVRIMMKANNTAFPYTVDNSGVNTQAICYDPLAKVEKVLPVAFANCKAWDGSFREVYVITSLAITPTGGRRITQVEVTQISLPPLPGAMTFTGDAPVFDPPSSAAFSVSGDDQNGRGKPPSGGDCYTTETPSLPAIGAQGAPADAALAHDVNSRSGQYTGGGGSPSVQDVSSKLGAFGTVGGLQQIQQALQAAGTNYYPPATNPSTPLSGITVVNGPYSGDVTGGGILLVTGDLTTSGNPSFNGIVLVIGTGKFTKNGGGNGDFRGGILFANLFDGSGNLLPSDHVPGAANVDWNGGGNASVCYDSSYINNSQLSAQYTNLAYSELPY